MPIRSPLSFPISPSLSFTAAGGSEPLLAFLHVCVSLNLFCVCLRACVSLLASTTYRALHYSVPLARGTDVEPGEKLESLCR